jgi:hypothetical protein
MSNDLKTTDSAAGADSLDRIVGPIPRGEWEWYGNAGHLCVSNWCRFHLTTKIGAHLVSTVGEYYPPHATERDCPDKPTTVGWERTYETMVFRVEGTCECGCGLPTISGIEIEGSGYNDPASATQGHYRTCERVASWPNDSDQRHLPAKGDDE